MLHIVNKSPYERNALDAVLRIAQSGSLLLIEDGVYAATRGSAAEARAHGRDGEAQGLRAAAGPRGARVADRVIPGVTPVDYGGFVDLVATHRNCQSWL